MHGLDDSCFTDLLRAAMVETGNSLDVQMDYDYHASIIILKITSKDVCDEAGVPFMTCHVRQ